MKIDGFVPSLPPENSGKPPQTTNSSSAVNRPVASLQPDATVLSTSADRVNLLAAQALSAPEVRNQRVTELSAAVREGRYEVGSLQIAAAIFGQLRISA